MGRRFFFDSGVSSVFHWSQPSTDIQQFGGIDLTEEYDDPLYAKHKWHKQDQTMIREKLNMIRETNHDMDWDAIGSIDEYEKNKEGTERFLNHLYNMEETCDAFYNESHVMLYILGLIIFHQLEYVDELECLYEE